MNDLVVVIPTRARPHNIPPLIESIEKTRAIDSRIILSVDSDDKYVCDYQDVRKPDWCELRVTEQRLRLGDALNFHAPGLAEEYKVIGFLGDDNRPRTVGWDWRIMEEMRPLGIIYVNDLIQRHKLPTAVFMDSQIVRTLGYFSAPGVIHLYIDDAWKALGEALGTLRYLGDCVIEHCHPLVGTAAMDDGYRAVNSPERWSTDGPAFDKWKAEQLERDVLTLRIATGLDLPGLIR